MKNTTRAMSLKPRVPHCSSMATMKGLHLKKPKAIKRYLINIKARAMKVHYCLIHWKIMRTVRKRCSKVHR